MPTRPVFIPLLFASLATGVAASRPCWNDPAPPVPGAQAGHVAEMSLDTGVGVLSVWLGNNVRAHHRHMDTRPGQVFIAITIAGGEIEETRATRGLTEAAGLAFAQPATRTACRDEFGARIDTLGVRVRSRVERDAVMLLVQCERAVLEETLSLLAELLHEPAIDNAAFDTWRERPQADRPARGRLIEALRESLVDALYPLDEVRTRALTPEEARAIDRADAQAWLDQLVRRAPIEVAVVGDVPRRDALSALASTLGALPARARMTPDLHDHLRNVPRAQGPFERIVVAPVEGNESAVLVGCVGVDAADAATHHRLMIVAQALETRLGSEFGEHGAHAWSVPAEMYPGFGLFYALLHVPAEQAHAAAAGARAVIDDLAENGLDENELGAARTRLANQFEEHATDPMFWALRLAHLEHRGREARDVLRDRAALAEVTTEDARNALRRVLTDEARLSFIVLPASE